MERRAPVAVLTGFLGSGKTTLLSSLLEHPSMGETAVIVNELGEIAIDHHLVRKVDERTVVLPSGCVCCSLRGDLADELRDLLERREQGELTPFRRIVVETTGLAEPAPILATLLSEPALKHRFRPEVVVTTVDAVHGSRTLDRHDGSIRQAAAADRIVVTKPDLVETENVDALVRRLVGTKLLEALVQLVPRAADVAPLEVEQPRGDLDQALVEVARLVGRRAPQGFPGLVGMPVADAVEQGDALPKEPIRLRRIERRCAAPRRERLFGSGRFGHRGRS